MGLLDEVEEIRTQKPGRQACGVAKLLAGDQLSESDRDELVTVMARPVEDVGHWAIQAILARRGVDMSQSIIGWHRNLNCSCKKADKS